MKRYVAFLRGMNLGNRRIKNDELRTHFEAIGMAEVATFRASGNVVFGCDSGETEAKLATRVEAELDAALGYDVPVFLRSDAEVKAIAAEEPFPPKRIEASKGKLQILLLAKRPTAAQAKKVLALGTDQDLLAIEARELYWLPSGGVLDSELDLKAIASTVGFGTQRTMGTIEQIAAKHCA